MIKQTVTSHHIIFCSRMFDREMGKGAGGLWCGGLLSLSLSKEALYPTAALTNSTQFTRVGKVNTRFIQSILAIKYTDSKCSSNELYINSKCLQNEIRVNISMVYVCV